MQLPTLVNDLPWDAVLMGSVVSTLCSQDRIRTCYRFAIKSQLDLLLNLGEVLRTNRLLTMLVELNQKAVYTYPTWWESLYAYESNPQDHS